MKCKIIVVCGGVVVIFMMVVEEIKELCQNYNIFFELIQCWVNEIEIYMDGVYLICTIVKVDCSFGDILLVYGMFFIFGIGIEVL